MLIFYDFLEDIMEVFMNDFSVYVSSFDEFRKGLKEVC